MIDSEARAGFVTELFAPVAQPLHEITEAAVATANDHLKHFGMLPRGWQHTALTRIHLDRLLPSADLPGFRLHPVRHNGRLQLNSVDGASSLRLLHAPPGFVPPPGESQARLRYWTQLQFELPSMLDQGSAFLGLWHVRENGSVGYRVVRPIGDWRFGRPALVDLELHMPRDAVGFDDLEFQPDDSDLPDLPPIELPADDEDEITTDPWQ